MRNIVWVGSVGCQRAVLAVMLAWITVVLKIEAVLPSETWRHTQLTLIMLPLTVNELLLGRTLKPVCPLQPYSAESTFYVRAACVHTVAPDDTAM